MESINAMLFLLVSHMSFCGKKMLHNSKNVTMVINLRRALNES